MTMASSVRKVALTARVTSSVGWLGSLAAFLALAIAGLNSQDPQTIRAAYFGMDVVTRFIIVPLALASLLTGLIQSLATPWGLFRHYWVVVKLLLTVFATTILLVKLRMVGYAAHLAATTIVPSAELSTVGMELRFHAAAGLLVLLVPTVLSVYKPWGVTAYGRRKQEVQKAQLQRPNILRQRPSPIPERGIRASSAGYVTVTLSRIQVLGLAAAILVVHLAILHVTGVGHVGH